MKVLLTAVDFSDASRLVVQAAETLATSLKAKILLIHITEPVASYVPVGAAMDVIETAPPPVLEENTSNQQKRLESFADPMRAHGIDVDTDVGIGLAADEIAARAEANSADYIVLGSHGHGALYNLFSGSVVTGVLKRAHVPVLVVPISRG